ncbi:RNA polymerase sigma-54 factor [Treponema sp. C6A8]|uniref:RNA polymerase factor sigma-54 n=1 Tax=Treponema sp. C6A8 TaxID=1410609 RepID=UPI00048816C7|nr:hypothetical protein [Treponema sp. C6A8]
MEDFAIKNTQTQSQKQVMRLSQNLVYGLKILQMPTKELRSEIYRVANENPALEIVRDPQAKKQGSEWEGEAQFKSQDYQALLENREDSRESLQQHLMHQLNSMRLSPDEYDLSQKLIYNLDKTGCYGSMRAPETLLDKSRPLQNRAMLERCISRIQNMDPVGTCCRTLEESLFVQAKIAGDASPLALFLLDGHLDFLNPPEPEKIVRKVKSFLSEWHSKKFSQKLPIDDEKINSQSVSEALQYILHLNPHPASEYSWETSLSEAALPDIVLTVTRESGLIPADDFSHGKIAVPKKDFHFQIKYASGVLPEIRLNQTADYDKQTIEAAKQFINNILFRQNTIVLQGCAIVKNQLEFFEKGPGNIAPLTRKQIADFLGIHLSTVSRMTARKNSKYIQTEFGLFPASYFFSSGVASDDNSLISAEAVKSKMSEIISAPENQGKKISDNGLAKLLAEEGIKIARRTVAKYRAQLGLQNSFRR